MLNESRLWILTHAIKKKVEIGIKSILKISNP